MEPLCMYIDGLLDLQQYFGRAEPLTSTSHIGLETAFMGRNSPSRPRQGQRKLTWLRGLPPRPAIGTSMLCRRQETQTEVYTCISPSGDYTQNMNVNIDLIVRKLIVRF